MINGPNIETKLAQKNSKLISPTKQKEVRNYKLKARIKEFKWKIKSNNVETLKKAQKGNPSLIKWGEIVISTRRS